MTLQSYDSALELVNALLAAANKLGINDKQFVVSTSAYCALQKELGATVRFADTNIDGEPSRSILMTVPTGAGAPKREVKIVPRVTDLR
jgi:hypothetical protein